MVRARRRVLRSERQSAGTIANWRIASDEAGATGKTAGGLTGWEHRNYDERYFASGSADTRTPKE